MAELRRRSSTFGVNGIGEPPKPGEGIGPHPELAVFGAPFRCDGAIRDGGHPDSAGGWATMELDQLVGDQASGVLPSNVADLMIRFRRVTGPSFAGASTSGAVVIEFASRGSCLQDGRSMAPPSRLGPCHGAGNGFSPAEVAGLKRHCRSDASEIRILEHCQVVDVLASASRTTLPMSRTVT